MTAPSPAMAAASESPRPPGAPAGPDAPTGSGTVSNLWRRRPPAARILLRLAWIGACALLAFWNSIARTLESQSHRDLAGYAAVLPMVALLLAVGLYRRRQATIPIHDRQADGIVGGGLLLGAIAVKGLLVPRYVDQFLLWRMDLLALLLGAAGAFVLMFGLRPTMRMWPGWLLLVLCTPLTYRATVVALGGTTAAASMTTVFMVALAMAVAAGRTLRRAAAGFAATLLLGGAATWIDAATFPDAPETAAKYVPALIAGAAVGAAMYLYARHHVLQQGNPYPVLFSHEPTVTTGIVKSGLAVLAAAVALAAIGLPQLPDTSLPDGPAPGPIAVPAGWHQEGTEDFDWARRYFGQGATLTRQTLQSDQPNPDWDTQGRRRTLVVDTLSTAHPGLLDIYPPASTYNLDRARVSPAIPVDLGHGVTGALSTVVDEDKLLTWSRLTFDWRRGSDDSNRDDSTAESQRITIITVDDHRPGAPFPRPEPSMASNVARTLTILLRGNDTVVNDHPEYKDRGLLTDFGRAFVAAQFAEREQTP